jgi:hypothetical protein
LPGMDCLILLLAFITNNVYARAISITFGLNGKMDISIGKLEAACHRNSR